MLIPYHRFMLCALLGAALCATSGSAQATVVYTANESSRNISVIDTALSTTISLELPFAPHNVDLTTDGQFLLATGANHAGEHHDADAMHHNAAEGHLALINLAGAAPIIIADTKISGHPAHVVPDASGRLAYVTDSTANKILVLSLPELKQVATIATGHYPHGLRLSPDGAWLATANMHDGTVSLINLKNAYQSKTISVGKKPVQVAFSPDQRYLVTSLNDENKVAVIDLMTHKLAYKTKTGRGPVQVYVTRDNRLVLVANQGTARRPDNRLTILALTTGKRIKTLTVGRGAHGVSISRDGLTAFVTNTVDNTVTEIDLTALSVRREIQTGLAPNGVVSR